jgi:hypothetical protein
MARDGYGNDLDETIGDSPLILAQPGTLGNEEVYDVTFILRVRVFADDEDHAAENAARYASYEKGSLGQALHTAIKYNDVDVELVSGAIDV